MEMGYDIVFKIAIVALAMMVIAVLVRAIKDPSFTAPSASWPLQF